MQIFRQQLDHVTERYACSAAPNKVALVSGANKGIGKEIARGLAKQGFTVLLGARKQELGEAAAAELAKDGQVHFQQLDVTDVQSVTAAAAAIKNKYGFLDVLVSAYAWCSDAKALCFNQPSLWGNQD